jgi:hypothetical protein
MYAQCARSGEGAVYAQGSPERRREKKRNFTLFSFRLCDSIHLAGQRLARTLVLGDKAREHPAVRQSDDLELFILNFCNLLSVACSIRHCTGAFPRICARTCVELTLIKFRVTSNLVIEGSDNTRVPIEGGRGIAQNSSDGTRPRGVAIGDTSRWCRFGNHWSW